MKQLVIVINLIMVIVSSVNAQAKTTGNSIIKVPGLHCDLDKDKIERYLFKSDGVTKIKIDVKRKTVAVSWITDRTNLEQIKYDIANTGYDADNVTAEEDARKRLPIGCRVVTTTPVAIPDSQKQIVPKIDSSKSLIKITGTKNIKPLPVKKK